jgi:Helix-turn-helix domain
MHGTLPSLVARDDQAPTSSSPITSSVTTTRSLKTRRKAQRSSKPKRALGPMTEPARLRALDWLLHQVGARMAERPPAYVAVAHAFALHFSDSDGKAYPSLETIATLCGLARRTIRDIVELLLADENIRIADKGEPGRGHPTTYAIVIKPLPDDVAEARRRVALREDRRKRAKASAPVIAKNGATVHHLDDTATPSRCAILDTGTPFPLRHEPSLREEEVRIE